MSIENSFRKYVQGVETLGKSALNIKYPDEFEVYLIAFELLDSKGKTIKYFIFPVMPSSVAETKNNIHNVKKTLGGISVLSTNMFVPTDITISGNFGRRFRILLGDSWSDVASSFKDSSGKVSKDSFKEGFKEVFDERVKTGYGSCKVLEGLCNQANSLDSDGGVRTLIFHNLAFGNSYVVKVMNFTFNQNQDSNMIWSYSLNLKSVAPLSALYSAKKLKEQRFRLSLQGYLQDRTDKLVNSLTRMLGQVQNKYVPKKR